MTDSTTRPPRTEPRTEAGKELFNDFLNGPGGFGYAGIDRYDLMRGILAIEAEAVGLMYGSDQEAGYAAVAEAEAAAPDAGLREAARLMDGIIRHVETWSTPPTDGFLDDLRSVRAALAAHRSSDPSPATYTEVERLDRPGNRANLERDFPNSDRDCMYEPGSDWCLIHGRKRDEHLRPMVVGSDDPE